MTSHYFIRIAASLGIIGGKSSPKPANFINEVPHEAHVCGVEENVCIACPVPSAEFPSRVQAFRMPTPKCGPRIYRINTKSNVDLSRNGVCVCV